MQSGHEAARGQAHWVGQGDIRLFVWEKCVGRPAGKKVVLLAHGSSTAGRESFDLQAPGHPSYSLMDFLAQQGFDVFALDVRGFGSSTRPEQHLTTEQAARDLDAVVDYLRELRGVAQVHLLAWSWGTQYAGQFVMAKPHKVARYISYAQMHANSPDLLQRKARLGEYQRTPYIRITESGWKLRFASMTPPEANEPAVVDAYARAAAVVETRTPTGPQLDMITRMPLIDATKITVPVMMIHGQYDDVADLDGLWPFFKALPNPRKKYVVIPDAGHMMHLQKGHLMFRQEVAAFFGAPD